MPTNKESLTIQEQDELQAAKRLQLNNQEQTALAEEINNVYQECCEMAVDLMGRALQMENNRIKIGTLLLSAKEKVRHGNFKKWVEDNCPAIGLRTAQRCMAISAELGGQLIDSLDGLKEYHKVLVRLGIKEPTQGHGPQRLHDWNAFTAMTKTISDTRTKISTIFEKEPLDEWEDDAKEQLKEQLQPIVEIWEAL